MQVDFQRDYLVRLPLPLAQLYSRAYNARDPRSRHDYTFYLFEALVKLTASAAIAAYLHDIQHGAARAPSIDALLAQLALPSLGQWVGMLRELARHFGRRSDAADHPLGGLSEQLDKGRREWEAVPALYRRIKNGPDGQPAGARNCSLQQLIDALVQYRNGVFGHGGLRFESFYAEEMGPLLFPAANEVLADGVLDMLGPPGSRLVYLTEVRMMDQDRVEVGLRGLVGVQGERMDPLLLTRAQAEPLLPNRVALLWPGRPAPLRLDPLLVYHGSEAVEDVLFLNRDRNGKQVEYLSYTTGRTEQDQAAAPALAALLSLVVNRPVGAAELEELAEQSRVMAAPEVAASAQPPSPGAEARGARELLTPGSGERPDPGLLRISLAVTGGPHQGQVFSFAGHNTFFVGRSRRAHFRLQDDYFSRIHFMVEVNPPHCRLTDLGSKNGTEVNGRKAISADLRDGDLIRAGTTVLRVSVLGRDISAAPAPAADPDAVRRAPPAVPGYQVLRELGHGSLGVTYLAVRASDGATVSLKVVTPAVAATRAVLERFLRAAAPLRALDHPRIIPLREMGETNGRLFFVSDHVPGKDTAGLLRSHGGPLPVERAVGLVCQLLEALEHAHARGLVHGDLKPGNVLVTGEGGHDGIKLADFGLAHVYHGSPLSGLTLHGSLGPAVAFLAPEQLTQFEEVRPPADQYAAGAVLYHLLTDRLIYDLPRRLEEQILRILQDDPVPIRDRRPGLPPALANIIHRSLAREEEARFADARVLRRALAPYAG
jgi:serine/threonine-protein kinase